MSHCKVEKLALLNGRLGSLTLIAIHILSFNSPHMPTLGQEFQLWTCNSIPYGVLIAETLVVGAVCDLHLDVFNRFRRKSDLATDHCSFSLALAGDTFTLLLKSCGTLCSLFVTQPCIAVPRNSNCTVAFEGF